MTKTSGALLFFLVCSFPRFAEAQALFWSDDDSCIDALRVEAQLATLRTDWTSLSVSIEVARSEEGPSARVSRDGMERIIEAPTCEELEESLVLVLSLFPSPDEVPDTEPPAREETPVESPEDAPDTTEVERRAPVTRDPATEDPETPPALTPVEPSAPAPRTPIHLWLSAGLDVEFGSLLRSSLGPVVDLSLERKRLWLSFGFVFRPEIEEPLETGTLRMGGMQGRLSVGGYAWRGPRGGLLLSGGSSLALITAESQGISAPADGLSVLWQADANAHVHWSPLPWLRVRAHAGLGVPLSRTEYRIQGLGAVYTTPILLFRTGISLEVRFWSRKTTPADTLE